MTMIIEVYVKCCFYCRQSLGHVLTVLNDQITILSVNHNDHSHHNKGATSMLNGYVILFKPMGFHNKIGYLSVENTQIHLEQQTMDLFNKIYHIKTTTKIKNKNTLYKSINYIGID